MDSYENPTLSETCDLYAEVDRLKAINAELVAALEQFANMDTVDLGRASLNNVRDDFMFDCPEFIGFCKQARAALAKAGA